MVMHLNVGFIISVTLITTGGNQAKEKGPLNTVAVSGSPVTFACFYNSLESFFRPLWWRCVSNKCSEIRLSRLAIDAPDIANRTSLKYNNQTGRTDLTIYAIRYADTGLYGCTLFINTSTTDYSANLTVIDTEPECFVWSENSLAKLEKLEVKELDHFHIGCAFDYSGNWSVTVSCPSSLRSALLTLKFKNSSRMEFRQNLTANKNEPVMIFSCIVYFYESPNPDTLEKYIVSKENWTSLIHQRNVSSYKVRKTIPSVSIRYGVNSATIDPVSLFGVHEELLCLNCSSDGSPSPTFKWTNSANNKVTHGSQFFVDPDEYRSNVSVFYLHLQCTSTNEVFGKSFSTSVNLPILMVYQEKGAITSSLLPGFIGFLLGCSIAFAGLVVKLAVVRHRRKLRSTNTIMSADAVHHYSETPRSEGDYTRLNCTMLNELRPLRHWEFDASSSERSMNVLGRNNAPLTRNEIVLKR